MKRYLSVAVGGVVVVVCGCQTYLRTQEQIRTDNSEPVETLFEEQDRAGIVAQRTLFSYHFVPGTTTLNPRGEDVLDVLSEHYIEHPGQLSMPTDGESEEIHRGRINRVQMYLAERGVDVETVQITEDRPEAGGITSHDMRLVQEADRERTTKKEQQGGAAGSIVTLGSNQF